MEWAAMDIVEVIAVGNQSPEEFQNRFHVELKHSYANTPSMVTHLRDSILWDFKGVMSSGSQFNNIKVRRVRPTPVTEYEVMGLSVVQGDWGVPVGPHQVAMLWTLKPLMIPGRRAGRIYIAGQPNNAFANGVYDAGFLQANINRAELMRSRYAEGGANTHFTWMIRNKEPVGGIEYNPLETIVVQSQPAIQRRRRRETV